MPRTEEDYGWYKRYPKKFIRGVRGMGPDLIGAYSLILDLIYEDEDSCPNDPAWLAGILGCNGRKARALIDGLLKRGKLSVNEHGRLVNEKASQVLNDRETSRQRARDSGETGGKRSAETRTKHKEDKELAEARLKELEESREDKKRKSPPKSTSQPSMLAEASEDVVPKGEKFEVEFSTFYAAYPRHVGRGAAETAYRRARRMAQASELLAGAQRYAAHRKGEDQHYTKHPATWLNAKGWLDELEGARGAPSTAAVSTDLWVWRLEAFHHGQPETDTELAIRAGYWQAKWGPTPGQPGCLAPGEAISAYAARHAPRTATGGP